LQPLEILSRHAATDDANQRQGYGIDPAPCFGVRLTVRAGVVVGRSEPLRPWFRIVSHSTARFPLKSSGHEAALSKEPEMKSYAVRP